MLLLVINYVLLHQFLSGLPASVSRQLRASGEANNLVKAIERARLLMSIDNESLPVAAVAPKPDLQQEKIERPTEQVAALSTQVANEQRKPNVAIIVVKQVTSNVTTFIHISINIC